MTPNDRRALHAEALSDADAKVRLAADGDLARPSACAGWPVETLIEHMVGQNFGFAEAIARGDAPVEAFRPTSTPAWPDSVAALTSALSRPASHVRLVEVAPERALPLDSVLGIHALDLAVHAWDLDQSYEPGPDLASLVLTVTRSIPPREAAGGQFAPALPHAAAVGDWRRALALVGRG